MAPCGLGPGRARRERRPGCGPGGPSGRLWDAGQGGGGRSSQERCTSGASVLLSRVRMAGDARQPRGSAVCDPKSNRAEAASGAVLSNGCARPLGAGVGQLSVIYGPCFEVSLCTLFCSVEVLKPHSSGTGFAVLFQQDGIWVLLTSDALLGQQVGSEMCQAVRSIVGF